MIGHRGRAHPQRLGDLPVAPPLRHQEQDPPLDGAQAGLDPPRPGPDHLQVRVHQQRPAVDGGPEQPSTRPADAAAER